MAATLSMCTSTPTQPQTTVVRDSDGKLVMEVAKQDITQAASLQAGFRRRRFTVKARDGKTDLYGFMFKPTNFDAAKKYPIVNHVYPGPQTGSCGSRSFSAARWDNQSLAELGFRRRLHRRHGNAVALEGLPRVLLWQSRRQHHSRPDRRNEGACRQISLDRSRTRRHLWTLRRRQRHGFRDVSLSRLLQGWHRRERQPRQPRVRRRLGGEVGRP